MANNDPTFMRRTLRDARNNPADFDAAVRQYTGLDTATTIRMLGLHRKLHAGQALDARDTKWLQATHPEVAHEIPAMVAAVNRQAPHTRANLFLGILCEDANVMQGRLHEASDRFKELSTFVADFHRESISSEVSARTDERVDSDIAARTIEKPQADPFSTRAILESQMGGREARLASDALESGSPDAEVLMRSHLVSKAERAIERLEPGAKDESTGRDLSTRDSVAAAFDLHEAEAVGEDLGYIDKEPA